MQRDRDVLRIVDLAFQALQRADRRQLSISAAIPRSTILEAAREPSIPFQVVQT